MDNYYHMNQDNHVQEDYTGYTYPDFLNVDTRMPHTPMTNEHGAGNQMMERPFFHHGFGRRPFGFGRRPFGFGGPFGGPFVGGFLGGLTSELLFPPYYGSPYYNEPYPPYPPYYWY